MSKNKKKYQKISFIVNPRAARNKWQRRRRLRNYLLKNMQGEIIETPQDKKGTVNIARKLSFDSGIIVAVGGDGTVSDVIQGIIESGNEKNIILGLVPFGSGNAFRKSLDIPKKAKKAIALLSEGKVKKIDLISIEGKVASFASIGATAQVTQKKLQYNIPGILGHLLASRILITLPRELQEIELIDGIHDNGDPFARKTLKLKLFDCVVGKINHFGYSWKIAPEAKIDDGFLDVTFFETPGPKYLLFFPFIYTGIFQKTQKHYKAKKIIIRGRNLPVQYNGEFLGEKDKVEIRVLPQALRIITQKTDQNNP